MESKAVKLGSELVELYARKSQIDHLIRSVLCHIWEAQKEVSFPYDFVISLKEGFAQLPAETVVDVWIILNKELLDHYNDDELDLKKFNLFGELTWLFVENISVDQIPERTASSLALQLKETVGYVLGHLKSKCLTQESVNDGVYVLCLLLLGCTRFFHSLTEESALFRALTRPSSSDLESVEDICDLSPLYSDLTAKQWKKIHRLIAKDGHRKLSLVWDHLLIRSLKVHLLTDVNDKVLARQCKLCDYLILQKLESMQFEDISDWNGLLCDVNDENRNIAFWTLILNNLPVLLPRNSSDSGGAYYKTFARVLMSVLLKNRNEMSKDFTLYSASLKFLNQFCHSNGIFKLESMNSELFSVWISSLSQLFNAPEGTRSKRLKSNTTTKALKDAFVYLEADLPSNGLFSEKGEVLWPSKELFALIDALLVQAESNEDARLDEKRALEAFKLLEIMRDFLLRCLDQVDSVRCLFATLALLAVSSHCGSLFEIGLQVTCGALVSGQNLHLVLQELNTNHFLSFIWSLSDYAECQTNSFDMKKLSGRLLKLALRIVLKHEKSIPHLNDFIAETVDNLTEMRKNRASVECLVKPLSRLVTCMESANKVLHHAYIRPTAKHLLSQSVEIMQKHFLKLTKKFCSSSEKLSSLKKECSALSGDSQLPYGDSFDGYLLLGFACQLHKSQDISENATAKEPDGMLQMLPVLCELCLKHLQNSENCDVLNRCLEFVIKICSHLDTTAKFLPGDFLSKIWTGTISVLQRFISSQHSLVKNNNQVHSILSATEMIPLLRKTITAVVATFELDEFERHLKLLQTDMKSCLVKSDCVASVAAFQIMQELTTQSLSDDFQSSLYLSCQKILVLAQDLFVGQRIPVVKAVLETGRKLVSLGPSFLESNDLSLCLSMFSEFDLESVKCVDEFVVLFNDSYAVLNALLLHQMNFVHNSIPAYMVVIKKLLRAVMVHSRQDHQNVLTHADIKQLDSCAHLLYRLSGLVCEHRIHFTKVAPFLIYEYVSEVQKGTLVPVVKATLVMAIYKWLSICSNYGVTHLLHILPSGARENFRFILEEFERRFKYRGTS